MLIVAIRCDCRLASMGIDVPSLWADIHDLIIKTMIAVEHVIVAAMDMHVPHKQCC